MRARRPRLVRTVGLVALTALLALNGGLLLLNLDKHGRVPDEARELPVVNEVLALGRGQPDRGNGGDDGVLGTDPSMLLVDEAADPMGTTTGTAADDEVDDWPGGRGQPPSGPPEPREILLTADGDLRVTGSAPSWALVTELAGLLGRRSGFGSLGVITREVTWHPQASDRLDDGVVRLEEPLLYDAGEIGVPEGAIEALVSAVELLAERPDLYLVVVAHVDDLGDSEANAAVASARASAVSDELVARGIDAARVVTVVAARDPEAPVGDDDETRRYNRRVEVRIENLLVAATAG